MFADTAGHAFELAVVEGRAAGARAPLSSDSVTTIGDSFDCDIVLRGLPGTFDPDQEGNRIGILKEGEYCRVQVLLGSVAVDERIVTAGDSFTVSADDTLRIGTELFKVLPAAEQSVDSETGLATQQPVADRRPARRFATLAGTALLGLCLVVAGVAGYLDQQAPNSQASVNIPSLGALLAGAGFSNLEVVPAADDSYRIRGRVANRARQIELKKLVATHGTAAQLDVSVDEVFREDVTEVYRLSGIESLVEITGKGEVTVSTATADLELLERVEQRAYEDIAGLSLLVRQNQPPAVTEDTASPDFSQLPGKRIKMVVSSDPAFILTEDGSRYFQGAILPSGYKIKSILEKTVQLERDNEIVDLVF